MNNKLNLLQIIWLAIRPKTLPAGIAGVIAGLALVYFDDGTINLIPALACFTVAVLLQIASNLANDVFDFEKGVDTDSRIGPTRVTQSGLMSPRTVKFLLAITIFFALLIGTYLAAVSSWHLLWVGLAAIICAIIYTGGPLPLGYYGFGDITVWIFFGPVSVCGTYFIQKGFISFTSLAIASSIGFLVTAILIVNNLRDIENDRAANKKTLAVQIGKTATRWQYSLCLLLAFAIIPILIFFTKLPPITLITYLTLILAIKPIKLVWREHGYILNKALEMTGKISLTFSLLFMLAILILKQS